MNTRLAGRIETLRAMHKLDLARPVGQNGVDAIVENIAVMKVLDALSAHAGIHIAITLQQIKSFATIKGIGAIARGKFVEPVTAQAVPERADGKRLFQRSV